MKNVEPRNMMRVSLEKRLPVTGDITGELVEISTNGVRLETSSNLLDNDVVINLPASITTLPIVVRPMWSRDINTEFFSKVVGALIVKPDSSIIDAIIKLMYEEKTRKIVGSMKIPDKNAVIRKFCNAVARYSIRLADLNEKIDHKKISKTQAHSELKNLTDQIMQYSEQFKNAINDKLVMRELKKEFRSIVAPWAYKSALVKHCYDKPRGYPGDFETLETIYDQTLRTPEGNIGHIFEMYFQNNPYAEAIRYRKEYIKNQLINFIRNSRARVKLLNLACGSCRELWEMFNDNTFDNDIFITCLDWEKDALDFSSARLSKLPPNVQIEWVKDDILNYAKSNSFFSQRGNYDVIYSIGLADYLPDRVNSKIIKNSFDNLNKNGVLIYAHKNKEIAFSHLPPEWFCQWEFIARNESDLMNLFLTSNLGDVDFRVDWDPTKDVFFINAHKRTSNLSTSNIFVQDYSRQTPKAVTL